MPERNSEYFTNYRNTSRVKFSKRTEQLGRDVTCLGRSQIFVAKKEMIEIIEVIELGRD